MNTEANMSEQNNNVLTIYLHLFHVGAYWIQSCIEEITHLLYLYPSRKSYKHTHE